MTHSNRSEEPEASRATTAVARRIAFCITELEPGGAEKGLFHLVTRLDRSKWAPRVYCLGPEAELSRALRDEGVCVECYGARSWRDLGALFWLTKKLREFRPELLQGFLFHGNLLGRLAACLAGVPVVLAGHRVAEREKHWHLWLDRWTRRLVSHHVCVSQGVAAFVMDQLHLQSDQVTVIPNGVTARDPNEAAGTDIWEVARCSPTAQVVLAVGRLHPQKGFLDLLAAFEPVAAAIPESVLLIVGEGSQRGELEEEIRRRKLGGRVTLTGRREDVRNLMRQANVFALTSRWEGMPNVVLEAMSVGLPVVAMDAEGVRDIIQNDQLGIVVNQGDISGLTQAILYLLHHPELASSMGKNSQHLVNSNFTLDEMALRYGRLYSQLIN